MPGSSKMSPPQSWEVFNRIELTKATNSAAISAAHFLAAVRRQLGNLSSCLVTYPG